MSVDVNRRGRRATAAATPAETAKDVARSVVDAPIASDAVVPEDGVAVLPEPTLIAEPGEPLPIVTASPPLAIEPSALDVVQADAAAARVEAGIEPAPDRGEVLAAEGQPTLTIEPDVAGMVDALAANLKVIHGATRRVFERREDDGLEPDQAFDEDESFDEGDVLTLDPDFLLLPVLMHELEQLALRDPGGMDAIRQRFSFDATEGDREDVMSERPASGRGRVRVIEVVGPPQGRRRAGRTFGPQAQRFLDGELSQDEIASLGEDPLLVVGFSDMNEADAFALLRSPVG